MARLTASAAVACLLACSVAASPFSYWPQRPGHLVQPDSATFASISRIGDGKCAAGVPHYLRVALAYDPILCMTTGGAAKTEAYLKEVFESSRRVFARDTCIRLELVSIDGFCDPLSGAFRNLLAKAGVPFMREAVPFMHEAYPGVSHWGLPSLPSLPSLPGLDGKTLSETLKRTLEPENVIDVLHKMYEQTFGNTKTDEVIIVSGIPFDVLNQAVTIPGCACLPGVPHYGYVFGTGKFSVPHEIGHTLSAPHSATPGIMTIQNLGIAPYKFTSLTVSIISTFIDVTGCLNTSPNCCGKQECLQCNY